KARYQNGMLPQAMVFPDGARCSVLSWRDVAVEFVSWCSRSDRLPTIPFGGRQRGDRYFLNWTPVHKDQSPMRPGEATKQIRYGDRIIYMDAHRSGKDFLGSLCMMCQEIKLNPDSVTIVLKE